MEPIRPSALVVAARVADALVYAAGLAGVVAGGLLFRDEEVAFALVIWVLTFVAGAALRLAAAMGRAVAILLARTERIEADLAGGPPRAAPGTDEPGDPWRRWSGWH